MCAEAAFLVEELLGKEGGLVAVQSGESALGGRRR
jgi:hypothetical protein